MNHQIREMSDKETPLKKQGESDGVWMTFRRDGDEGHCVIKGEWTVGGGAVRSASLEWSGILSSNLDLRAFRFSASEIESWDSSLIVFLDLCRRELADSGKGFDPAGLPAGILKLLGMCGSKRPKKIGSDFSLDAGIEFFETGLGRFRETILGLACFWAEWLSAFLLLFIGRSGMRLRDLIMACRTCGASALPIVTLISFLTGLTMAFVGSVQLEKFNAKIYIADLVSLAMVREMGALMVAIVMAGRTGAAFAAELGSMKLNEEIDSLRTFGISPMQFLVLPRTLGLLLMTPLLTLYADVVGILGGLTVGTQVMDFSVLHYYDQTQSALRGMWEVYSGLIKSLAFGLIIGLVGCYKGLGSGKDSASLGRAVTSSVVTSVTLIVVVDALFEITFSFLDLR
ncbi:MAG TPA: hypothetical protein DCX67_07780 [Opitutae bacterium]|nr:hypothetical protein [Opitutae bacterium]